jgi:hypothetical protein
MTPFTEAVLLADLLIALVVLCEAAWILKRRIDGFDAKEKREIVDAIAEAEQAEEGWLRKELKERERLDREVKAARARLMRRRPK